MIRGALLGVLFMLTVFVVTGLLVGTIWIGETLWGPWGPGYILGPLFIIGAAVGGALFSRR